MALTEEEEDELKRLQLRQLRRERLGHDYSWDGGFMSHEATSYMLRQPLMRLVLAVALLSGPAGFAYSYLTTNTTLDDIEHVFVGMGWVLYVGGPATVIALLLSIPYRKQAVNRMKTAERRAMDDGDPD